MVNSLELHERLSITVGDLKDFRSFAAGCGKTILQVVTVKLIDAHDEFGHFFFSIHKQQINSLG